MSYRGDIRLGETHDFKFTTRRFSSGAPFTLAGSPVISAYVGNSTTELTAGITLTVDFDSRTGLNNIRVVATGGNGYATTTDVDLVITTGTVDSVSVVGEVVASFSIENRSAVMPTTVGRTLDVSAGGEAGVDWANVGSPTTAVGLTGTTISTAQVVASVTGAVGSVTGNVGGNVVGSVASVTGAVGSVTGNVGGNVTGSVGSVVGAVGSVTGAVGSVTGNIGGNLLGTLTTTERNAISDAMLDRNMATGTDSGTTTIRTMRQAMRFLRNKWSITGGTLTVCKEDDTTASWTGAVTQTAGNPVSQIDPAG